MFQSKSNNARWLRRTTIVSSIFLMLILIIGMRLRRYYKEISLTEQSALYIGSISIFYLNGSEFNQFQSNCGIAWNAAYDIIQKQTNNGAVDQKWGFVVNEEYFALSHLPKSTRADLVGWAYDPISGHVSKRDYNLSIPLARCMFEKPSGATNH